MTLTQVFTSPWMLKCLSCIFLSGTQIVRFLFSRFFCSFSSVVGGFFFLCKSSLIPRATNVDRIGRYSNYLVTEAPNNMCCSNQIKDACSEFLNIILWCKVSISIKSSQKVLVSADICRFFLLSKTDE